jgi:hypothetical protein
MFRIYVDNRKLAFINKRIRPRFLRLRNSSHAFIWQRMTRITNPFLEMKTKFDRPWSMPLELSGCEGGFQPVYK